MASNYDVITVRGLQFLVEMETELHPFKKGYKVVFREMEEKAEIVLVDLNLGYLDTCTYIEGLAAELCAFVIADDKHIKDITYLG